MFPISFLFESNFSIFVFCCCSVIRIAHPLSQHIHSFILFTGSAHTSSTAAVACNAYKSIGNGPTEQMKPIHIYLLFCDTLISHSIITFPSYNGATLHCARYYIWHECRRAIEYSIIGQFGHKLQFIIKFFRP